MKSDPAKAEIEALLRRWQEAVAAGDAAAAAQLRTDDYSLTLPDGRILDGDREMASVRSADEARPEVSIRAIDVAADGDSATAVAEIIAGRVDADGTVDLAYDWTIGLSRREGQWRVARSVVEPRGGRPIRSARSPASVVAGIARGLVASLKRALPGRATFQELAYVSYCPGDDYMLPLPDPDAPEALAPNLPIPPQSLWLGYNYPAHGRRHVNRMLDIVGESGLSLEDGDRVLDFGCGAGRLIRHLAHLADRCEIWGTDISAAHINWCRQHLRPPFHFATTTKVPHLPFEDRSFNLVYCGSVFTHIDDLADAWLLELHRILAPGGRLYLTLHDERTIALFEEPRYRDVPFVRRITNEATFRKAKGRAAMFTVERDDHSQVFYDSRFFERMLTPMFDIASVTPEAYFYQTAYCLKRRGS